MIKPGKFPLSRDELITEQFRGSSSVAFFFYNSDYLFQFLHSSHLSQHFLSFPLYSSSSSGSQSSYCPKKMPSSSLQLFGLTACRHINYLQRISLPAAMEDSHMWDACSFQRTLNFTSYFPLRIFLYFGFLKTSYFSQYPSLYIQHKKSLYS